jgi:hypothetical protein
MKHTKKEIGKELKNQLEKKYNIERISNWAYDLFISLRGELSPELDDILDRISLMAAGPEFEYTEQELKLLAELLINEEKDPIKQIDDLKFKDIT